MKKHLEKLLKKQKISENEDVERRSCLYVLSLNSETRSFIDKLYDFDHNNIEPSGLDYPWQTSTSRALTILAFNLYNEFTTDCSGQSSVMGIMKYVSLDIMNYIFVAMQIRFCGLVV